MSNEIAVIWLPSIADITVDVFQPDGSQREFNIGPLTEYAGTHQSLYLGSCATIVAGDRIIASQGSNFIGGTEYKQQVQGIGGASGVRGAGYIGDYKENEIIPFFWHTAIATSTDGTIKVYKKDGADEVTTPTGITDTRNFDSKTGVHLCSINLSANSFYAQNRDYMVVLSGAVIDGSSVNAVIATFSIKNRFQGEEFEKQG